MSSLPFEASYTLNLNIITSPSFTMYSFPSNLINHFSLALFRDQQVTRSVYFTTSALMNHLSKSVWIAQAAWGAVEAIGIVHDFVSSSHVVK